jgi:hypothetical protein
MAEHLATMSRIRFEARRKGGRGADPTGLSSEFGENSRALWQPRVAVAEHRVSCRPAGRTAGGVQVVQAVLRTRRIEHRHLPAVHGDVRSAALQQRQANPLRTHRARHAAESWKASGCTTTHDERFRCHNDSSLIVGLASTHAPVELQGEWRQEVRATQIAWDAWSDWPSNSCLPRR